MPARERNAIAFDNAKHDLLAYEVRDIRPPPRALGEKMMRARQCLNAASETRYKIL